MGLVSEYLERKSDEEVKRFSDRMYDLSRVNLALSLVLFILTYFNQWYFMLAVMLVIMSIFYTHWYQDAQAELAARRWTAYKGNRHG